MIGSTMGRKFSWVGIGAIGVLASCGTPVRNLGGGNAGIGGVAGDGGSSGKGASSGKGGGSGEGGGSGDVAGSAGEDAVAGDKGIGGGAGGGAAGGPSTCVNDDDCSDHLKCTGVETCVANKCNAGTPVACTNPDATNCDATCSEDTGACVVRGKDKDKDGHFSSACVAKPGDDCDDSAPTVYTGADEICDHLDNDCDGATDLADGLALSGANNAIASSAAAEVPSIAYAANKSLFAIAFNYSGSGTPEEVEIVGPKGNLLVPPVRLDAESPAGHPVLLGDGGDNFGAMWNTGGGFNINFRTVSITGVLGNLTPIGGLAPIALSRIPNGNWGLLFDKVVIVNGTGNLQMVTVSSAGVVSDPPVTLTNDLEVAGGISGTSAGFGQAYARKSDDAAIAAFWSPTLGTSKPLAVNGVNPVVGGNAAGFAIAVAKTNGTAPEITMYDAMGNKTCSTTFGGAGFVPAKIAPSSKGYLVISPYTQVREVLSNCTAGQSFAIQGNLAGTSASIAGGAAGFGVVWLDGDVPRYRMFGPDFCN